MVKESLPRAMVEVGVDVRCEGLVWKRLSDRGRNRLYALWGAARELEQ